MPRWTVHLEGGPRRVNHAAVAIGDRIYSFGGYCTGEDYSTTRPMDVHVLYTVNYRWLALPVPVHETDEYMCVPFQRYGHTAVDHNDNCYIWGGRNDRDGACNRLFCFDTTKQEWVRQETYGHIPGARDGHSACVIKGKMYIFGGYEEQVDKFSNEIHTLDFSSWTWTLVRPFGKAARWRDFHSATGINDNMYIFGGRSDRGGPYHTNHEIYCNKMEIFNTRTNTWIEPTVTGDEPVGRRSHSAFVYNNKDLYIFGGYNGLHELHFKDMYKFDTERNHWSRVEVNGEGPCERRRQCCCVIDNRVFLFGGTSPLLIPHLNGPEYDLIDQSDLHVLDFSPSLRMLSMLACLKYKNFLDLSVLPRSLRIELNLMITNNNISRPPNMFG